MNIQELEKLARAATPGPWFSDKEGRVWRRHPAELYENGGSVAGDKPMASTSRGWFHEGSTGYPSGTNASYIAAASPIVVLELIERIREFARVNDDLLIEREELQAEIQYWRDRS